MIYQILSRLYKKLEISTSGALFKSSESLQSCRAWGFLNTPIYYSVSLSASFIKVDLIIYNTFNI